MKLVLLVTIFAFFGAIMCENFLVVQDFPTETETLSNENNNALPVALSYNEISEKVKKVAININKFIEVIVTAIRLGGKGIEPIALPDVTETFSDKILFVNIEGQFLMRNGELHNIKSIAQHGNATLKHHNMKLYINSAFIFDDLNFNYDFISKIVSLGPRGYMYGSVRQMIIETVFVYDILENKLSLNKTSITDKVPIDVRVQVSVVIDWLANPIISWLSKLYEDKILLEIQDAIETAIRNKLPLPSLFFEDVDL